MGNAEEEPTVSGIPNIRLSDGAHIPQLGFGVFKIEPDKTAAAVSAALEIGYRHIDTAEMYGNEKEVGEGIRAAGVNRADVFITSKLNNGFHEPDDARRAFDDTLTRSSRTMSTCSHPLAAADALRRGLRLNVEGARGVRQGRTGPQHRRVELRACTP